MTAGIGARAERNYYYLSTAGWPAAPNEFPLHFHAENSKKRFYLDIF